MSDDAFHESPPVRVAANAAALSASRLFTSALLLVWQIVLARGLGVERYGIYGTIGAVMAVGAAIPDLGAGLIFIRDVARRPVDSGRYLGAAVALHAGLAVLAYGVVQAAAAVLGYDHALRGLLAFVGVSLLIDALGTAAHNQFVAAERMSWAAAIAAGHVCLMVGLGSLALAAGGGLWSVYFASVGAGVCRTAAFWVALRDHGWRPEWPVDRGVVRRLFTGGLPLGVAALLSLGFLHADKLASTAILGASATGQLVAAFVLVFGIVELIGTTVLVAALPAMSRSVDPRERRLDPLILQLVSFDVLAGLPATALLVVFGSTISSLVFGAGFGSVAGLWSVTGWFIIVHMIEGVLAQALIVRDRQSRVLTARAGGLLVNLALTLMLLPRIGVVGAAVGMLVGELVIAGAMVRQLAPPPEWWARLGGQAARLAMSGVALFGALVFLGSRIPLFAAAAVGIAAYVAVAMTVGAVTVEHRAFLAGAVRGMLTPADRRRVEP